VRFANSESPTRVTGIDFAGLPLDHALRFLLTSAGFFLPGEAQKIDRIAQSFANAYYEDNRTLDSSGDPRLFAPSSSDVVLILTFSLIMLHTDAHNVSIKKERKMTLQQFITNNR
jgi:Sec7-like guanine-nucleotide exchange factor